MKRTSYFRPSIHGWPFGNSWDWTISFPFPQFDITLYGVGFCGGMSWTALDKFYRGIRISRDTPAPPPGSSIYNEIEQDQVGSVADIGKLYKMYEWQMSPKLGGHPGNPHRSLGSRTQFEWDTNIKLRFSSPDPNANKPVTLTLIMTSNDYDPTHLVKHHRVVAYGYEERRLYYGEYVHGQTNSQIRHIKLYIYDPNEPDDDNVYLTFCTNCDDDWIGLNHSKGFKVAGFFVDDLARDYATSEILDLQIGKLEMTEIISETRALFDLQFQWKSRVIPYFRIQVNSVDWLYNEPVKGNYLPVGNVKQCPTTSGSMTVNLKLPRDPSTVSVWFLEDDAFTVSREVSVGMPFFHCFPYFWGQNEEISARHFYFADKDPSENELKQYSSPSSRVIHIRFPTAWVDSDIAFPWFDLIVNGHLTPDFFNAQVLGDYSLPTKRYLGNITKALYANFSVGNLVSPIEISATIKTIKNGHTISTINRPALPKKGAVLFEGFSADDYNDDTLVEISIKCTDKFGVVLEEQIKYHGRSIIEFSQGRQYPEFPPYIPMDDRIPSVNFAKYEAAVHKLIEMGLLEFKTELDVIIDPDIRWRPPFPQPEPDPVALLKALRSDRRLQRMIHSQSNIVWQDRDMWLECLEHHSEILNQEYTDGISVYHSLDKTDRMVAWRDQVEEVQRDSDAVIIGAFAEGIIKKLRQNPAVERALKLL